VVLIPVDFLDGTGVKTRPAVVLTSRRFNEARRYFIFTALTGSPGNDSWVVEISDLGAVGLSRRTYCHGILRQAENAMVRRIVGQLVAGDQARLRQFLRATLNL
jgi:mRNA-degrading endonuclease toxin of MazEF toxin-antitoxin module